ncbi:MAG: hypothetical protein KY391_07910 [Actinobacteria bacterium]|nr:hypothetical protein [Actinomycetota bacterium]
MTKLKRLYGITDKEKEVRVITFLIIFVTALAVVDVASSRFGRDSRDGNDWFTGSNPFEVGQR